MAPQKISTDDRLDKIVGLLSKIMEPMASVLKEIKASNRSRWIVLTSMLLIVMVVAGLMWVMMQQMMVLMDRVETTQNSLVSQSIQVQQLVEFASRTARTPEQKKYVRSIRHGQLRSPAELIKAAAPFAPETVMELARELEKKDGSTQE